MLDKDSTSDAEEGAEVSRETKKEENRNRGRRRKFVNSASKTWIMMIKFISILVCAEAYFLTNYLFGISFMGKMGILREEVNATSRTEFVYLTVNYFSE